MSSHPNITILPFPQKFDGRFLQFRVLVAPRNSSPLRPLYPGAAAFAHANLQLRPRIVSGLKGFPAEGAALADALPFEIHHQGALAAAADIFSAIAGQFTIVDVDAGAQVNLPASKPKHFIKKYLPESYRNSFNFQKPRTDRAVVDDSYRCAMRNALREPNPNFKPSPETVTWGQVFAFCLRQPLIAEAVGLIRTGQIDLDGNNPFSRGGFLYIDLDPSGDYGDLASPGRRLYAARIPRLRLGEERMLFAPVLFPVLQDAASPPAGNFDPVFFEAAAYDDGFAKIVHADQPISSDMLEEVKDDNPPVHDAGIRLGWDDEQILIWLNRQMEENPAAPGSRSPLDAPAGVFGYRLDIWQPEQSAWTSLCAVRSRQEVRIGNQSLGIFDNELVVEVHPAQLDGDQENSHYWLPQFFTAWGGKSMALPDLEAASLYRNDLGPERQVQLSDVYQAVGLDDINLRYGQTYEFRVRMSDLTGGGPSAGDDPVHQSPAPVARVHFRRYVAPSKPVLRDLPDGGLFAGDTLSIERPLLEYPAVAYTGKYANAIGLLSDKTKDIESVERAVELALPDPDVVRVRIDVELETLQMDNLASISKREAYIHYYTTYREFPDFDPNTGDQAPLHIPLVFQDADVLDFSAPDNTGKDILGISLDDLHSRPELLLPTARNIRLTVRAMGENEPGYFGRPRSNRGKPLSFTVSRPAQAENNLFLDLSDAERIKGIFLRPQPSLLALPERERATANINGAYKTVKAAEKEQIHELPTEIERLAGQMGLLHKGMTLLAKQGRRVQLGCSSRIRHVLSPDHTAITFADSGELINQWIIPLRMELNRDWTWNGMRPDSFTIRRTLRYEGGSAINAQETEVGSIELTRTASITDITNPDRRGMTLYFIDAVDPKPRTGFPKVIHLTYTVEPRFINAAVPNDFRWQANLRLPITTPPAQIPEILSVGYALSPYRRDERYSETEPRQRFLWIELKDPLPDPTTALFVRMLAYAPDPLLSRADPALENDPDEPPLALDPEYTRVVHPGQSDDNAGMDAMQLAVAASSSSRHFLVPLPPGLTPESPELFGFFTYELRIGHHTTWSTAQGRLGRKLRANGLGPPKPSLLCSLSRTSNRLTVQAPFAKPVFRGRNLTPPEPNTELWAFLYAQVAQADGADFRNVLLGEKIMSLIKPTAGQRTNRDKAAEGSASWSSTEIRQLLNARGINPGASLSLLCVEVLPDYSKLIPPPPRVRPATGIGTESVVINQDATITDSPIAQQLGYRRILRTSKLTKVPDVCKQEIPKFPPFIAAVETAIPAFIGYTQKADKIKPSDLINVPTKIGSFAEYEAYFGRSAALNVAEVILDDNKNFQSVTLGNSFYMYDSLRLFYANGGGDCYIVSTGIYETAGKVAGDFTDPEKGISALEKVDEPTILVFPDNSLLTTGNDFYSVYDEALAQCGKLMDRVGLFHLKEDDPQGTNFRAGIGINNLKYGMAYTPWLKVNFPENIKYRDFKDVIHIGATRYNLANLTDNADIVTLITEFEQVMADVDTVAAVSTALAAPENTLRARFNSLEATYLGGKTAVNFMPLVNYMFEVARMVDVLVGADPRGVGDATMKTALQNLITSTLKGIYTTLISYDKELDDKIGPYAARFSAGTVPSAAQWDNIFGAAAPAESDVIPATASTLLREWTAFFYYSECFSIRLKVHGLATW
jgi:hypothetical protein